VPPERTNLFAASGACDGGGPLAAAADYFKRFRIREQCGETGLRDDEMGNF
jgi:hypothetical protein